MSFFCRWQLHFFDVDVVSDVVLVLIVLALCAWIVAFMFLVHEYEIFTVFLFSRGWSWFALGKCLSSSVRNFLPMLVVTASFQGGDDVTYT